MSYAPCFAIINAEEIQRLNREGAPASVFSVYLALCAYAQGDASCFPSLVTIKEFIQGSITLPTISRALRWLRERKFIKQNHRTSKERFELTYRSVVKSTSALVKRAKEKAKDFVHLGNRGDQCKQGNRPKNQKGKPFYRKNKFSRRKKEMGYGRFHSEKEAENGQVCKAEKVYADWRAQNHTLDPKTLSLAELSIIVQGLVSSNPVEREWRRIMEWCDENKRTFDLLLKEGRLKGVVT